MTRYAPRHAAPPPPRPEPGPDRGRPLLESRRVLVLLVALSVVVTLVALGMGVATATAPPRCVPVGEPTHPERTPLPRSEPTSITVGSVDACSTLVPVGVDAQRRIEVPSVRTPMQAGWYSLGPTPGQRGPAVVVGHVNGAGQAGVFADLDDVRSGDRVAVTRRDGRTAVFVVTGVVQAPKKAFPTDRVYGRTPDPQLRLITCGGALDRVRHDYADNVVVFAAYIGWR